MNRSASSGRCGITRIARVGSRGGGQAIHSVLPDPTDPAHVTVAMSTGGVYRTYDRGETWNPANAGIKVSFAPDPLPEFGQCVHKIAAHPDAPNRMFAQNHGGVYRSDNGGDQWTSIADGLPSDFGFPIVVHPRKPETVFVFPLSADINASRQRARRAFGAQMTRVRAGRRPSPAYRITSMRPCCAMP